MRRRCILKRTSRASLIEIVPPVVLRESDHQARFFDWAKLTPVPGFPGRTLHDFAFAVPNGAMLAGSASQRARYMAFLKRQGLKKGVSDIFVAIPMGRFHGVFLEMKRDRHSRVSEEQRAWIELMTLAGYYARKVLGFDEARAAMQAYFSGQAGKEK